MDIQSILNTIQPEIVSFTIAAAVGIAAYIYQWGVQRLPTNVRQQVQKIADTTVQAIEQKYNSGSPGGALKKQEAMQMLADICKSLGLPLDQAHASAAIEAAVYGLNLFQKKPLSSETTQVQSLPIAKPAG